LSELENLETIQFDNQMIDSFRFLDKLQNLKGAYIHNLVQDAADGDKEPLMRALNRTNGQIWEPKKKKS
jgi:hypothetical protein